MTLIALCWGMTAVFLLFQYRREKVFRANLLDSQLQMHNERIIDDMGKGMSIKEITNNVTPPFKELRLTVVDRSGAVIFDNSYSTPYPTTNHNNRPEISGARRHGKSFTVDRHSVSDNVDYFYSARLGRDGIVVRSAIPYGHSLQEFLRVDKTFIITMCLLTLGVSLLGYFATRRISFSIKRLNRFAGRAERGERIFSDEPFPNDELGSIASHIVRLYIQRDKRHQEALRMEQEKTRIKKQLTNNINHELKTPLASISICLDLLHDHPELSDEKKRYYISRMRKDASRLSSMLKDVAMITRMDEGGEQITKERISLLPVINSVVAEESRRTDMKISVNVPDLKIQGNYTLLESIFRNLIDNAIAYSGGTEIRIDADEDGNFTVSDNGTGIPENHLPHIFERFYRIDKGRSRDMGGTGLGLSIVRNAVIFHGGTISVANRSGLHFTFRLPPDKTATGSMTEQREIS